MKKLIAAILSLVLLMTGVAIAEEIQVGEMINRFAVTNTKGVRLRTDSNAKSKPLAEIKSGVYVFALREEINEAGDNWTVVLYKDQYGYIRSDFLDVLSQEDSDAYMSSLDSPISPMTADEANGILGVTPTPEPTATPTPSPEPTPTPVPAPTKVLDDDMGIWQIYHFVDEYQRQTSNRYIINDGGKINGTFSNSATTNSDLRADILISQYWLDKSKPVVEIMLYEYGRSLVKGKNFYNCKYLDAYGKEHTVVAGIAQDGDRITFDTDDSADIIQALIQLYRYPFTMRIEQQNTYGYNATYLFTIEDPYGIEYAYRQLFGTDLITPPPVAMSENERENILEIQEALVRTGYLDAVDVTGIYDKKTRRAVVMFQDDHELYPDGSVAGETLDLLLGE